MKSKKALICGALALSVLAISACGRDANDPGVPEPPTNTTASEIAVGDQGFAGTSVDTDNPTTVPPPPDFSFSAGLDANGFWQGVNAADYVEMFDFQALSIPANVHTIPDASIQEIIDDMMAHYSTRVQITDRQVEDGDTINVDFVGSAGGVEFDGGSTGGMGTYVTIGETPFIDGFLDQLIGHTPGAVVNVEVTFPDNYFEASLAGVDALFVTTIHYIAGDTIVPELTDDFVQEHFSHMDDSIVDVESLIEDIRNFLQNSSVMEYVRDYLASQVTVHTIPAALISYFEQEMLLQYEEQAWQFGMEVEELIIMFGFESMEELMEEMRPDVEMSARYSLILQAVAQAAGITVGQQEVAAFFMENFGTDDYAMFEEFYGLPWLKQFIRNEKTLDFIIENVVLA